MAARSTRQKIIQHANKLPEHLDRILGDLQAIDILSDGRHPTVTEYLPPLVAMLEEARKALEAFRNQL